MTYYYAIFEDDWPNSMELTNHGHFQSWDDASDTFDKLLENADLGSKWKLLKLSNEDRTYHKVIYDITKNEALRASLVRQRRRGIPDADDPRYPILRFIAYAVTFLMTAAVFLSGVAVISWFLPHGARLPLFFVAVPCLIWFLWSFYRWRAKSRRY
jgi:hypothetical protein